MEGYGNTRPRGRHPHPHGGRSRGPGGRSAGFDPDYRPSVVRGHAAPPTPGASRGRRGRHASPDGGRSRGPGGRGAGFDLDYHPSVVRGGRGHTAPPTPGASRGGGCRIPRETPTLVNAPDIQSLSLIQKSSPVANQIMVPIRRPDRGGFSASRSTSIIANHFLVQYNESLFIGHYDLDIKPQQSPNNTRPPKLKKSDFRLIRNQLSLTKPDHFPLSKTVFDGERNLYSCVDLATGQFEVKYSEAQDREGNTFLVTLKLVNKFDLSKLTDYLSGTLLTIPRHVMQALDVSMKEHPARNMILSGGCFYDPLYNTDDTIGNGIFASSGFNHSLKPTSQGLALCVDYSVAPFWKSMGLVEFLKEYFGNFDMTKFKSRRWQVEKLLIGMKVQVTHRKTSQKFIIRGLTPKDTKQLAFRLKDHAGVSPERDVFLVDYFKDTYGWTVQNLNVPCLELGTKDKPNHVPMECCIIVPGQRLLKDGLETDAAKRLKDKSIVAPSIRMDKISRILQCDNGPRGGDVIGNFGLSVDQGMTKVKGRVIGPPELKIRSLGGGPKKVNVDQERCQWNLVEKCVLEGKLIDRWAVIDFTAKEKFRLDANNFIRSLIVRCMNLRIRLNKEPVYLAASMKGLSNDHDLRNILQDVIKNTEKEKKGKPEIILCVMTGKHAGYKLLKWISETEIGILTQCCLCGPANKANDQYLANLAMKINAKLGGSNMELLNHLPRFEQERNVMFVGADVNHPSQSDPTIPSIAAVVATMNWPGANRYAARVQTQAHRCEQILNFAEMCFDLVLSYESFNGRRPDRIMIFRDGVSEGQSYMVLQEELARLKQLFEMQGYSPSLTLIVARKRHQTRLFLENVSKGGSSNISPGTVVDTKIVHPYEFDFYLCSHHGAIGTSKSTYYHVLLDDHGFSSDELQKFIYYLCFTFARCTKPVSLVTPVYYADLAAYRGRMYYEASLGVRSSASSSSTLPTMDLHSNLKNSMFFI